MAFPSILHIDSGKTFRGGQRQLLLLAERLQAMDIKQVIACPSGSELIRRIEGIPTIGLSTSSLSRKLFRRPLREAIGDHGINIIHAHDSESHSLGILLKKKFPESKLMVTRRVIFPPSGPLSRRLKYRKYVDQYIAISRAVAESLIESGVDERKIAVIYSALDIDKIQQTERDEAIRSELPDNYRFLIVSAGALTAEKDFATAIKAVKAVSQKIDGVGLVILGEGPEISGLEEMISREKLDNIKLLGHREPMAPIFKACDLFIMTSISEGLNSSAIEAAACGLPLVVSNVGGLPEIAEKEYNGILCGAGHPEEFAEAIRALIDNDKTRIRMGENSVSKSRQFNIDQSAQKTAELYNRILAEQT